MPIGLKGNSDGSGAIQIGGSDAISISTGLNTTFAGTVTATGTVAGTTGTLYPIVSGTAVTASGTSIDFTGIPSWVKRITVMFNGVSTNGTSLPQIQLGSGSITSSGYVSQGFLVYGSNLASVTSSTSGITIFSNLAADILYGAVVLNLVSGSSWLASGTVGVSGRTGAAAVTGSIALSGTLDRVRITTVNGTDTFDAGTINILYE